jgi:hypothetical protein
MSWKVVFAKEFTEVMRDDTPSAAGSAAYTSILLYVDVASTR